MAAKIDSMRYVKSGWAFFTPNIKQFSIAGFISFVIFGLGAFLPFVPIIAGGPLVGGIFILVMNGKEGEEIDIKQMQAVFDVFIPLLFIGIITQIFIGIGFVLLILPGIFLWGCYIFAYIIALDKRVDFWSAMEQSRKFGFENKKDIFIFALILGVINLIGAIPFGLGLIITVPLTVCIVAEAYEDLFGFESLEVGSKTVTAEDKGPIPNADGFLPGQFVWISVFVEKANPQSDQVKKLIGKAAPSAFRQIPLPKMSGYGISNWPDDEKQLRAQIKTTVERASLIDLYDDNRYKRGLKMATDPKSGKRMAIVIYIAK